MKYVAIKVINNIPTKHRRRGSTSGPEKELDILSEFKESDHNIIKLLDVIKDRKYVYIVTDLCEGGTLKELIGYSQTGRLEEKYAVQYLFDIVRGIENMHDKGIMHRDLNLENIFLKGGRCKIGDFGSATRNEISDTPSGTPEYRAPEIFKAKNGKTYDKQVDVWSIGIIFHEMLFGDKPYEGDIDEIPRKIEAKPYQIPQGGSLSKEIKDLLSCMILGDPQKRITVGEIIKHPLFDHHMKILGDRKMKESITTKEEDKDFRFKEELPRNKYYKAAEYCIILLIGFLVYKCLLKNH